MSEDILSTESGARTAPGREADRSAAWRNDHPVDIRLTIPLPFLRSYVTIVAGAERRSPERRRAERRRHPIRTIGNLLFLVTTIVVFYGVFLAFVLAYSSILE